MTCDHAASVASLRVFLASTVSHEFHDFDETVLVGNCRGCGEPLSVGIDLARGHVVRGELSSDGAVPRHIDDDTAIGIVRPPAETGDEHARRLIK